MTEKICDMLYCDSIVNVQPLSKYIQVCEGCWFSIMNGIHHFTEEERKHLERIEKKRKEEVK